MYIINYKNSDSTLQDYLNTEPDYLNVEEAISLVAGLAKANQRVPCSNDVIACTPISMRPLEFHD